MRIDVQVNGKSILLFRIIPKMNLLGGLSAPIVRHGGIMASRRIDIGVSKYIGNDINVAGFMIEIRTKRGAKFMRAQMLFQGSGGHRVFFYHHLNSPNGDALVLKREKKRILIARECLFLTSLI